MTENAVIYTQLILRSARGVGRRIDSLFPWYNVDRRSHLKSVEDEDSDKERNLTELIIP
jgi:hypothetical protein